MKKLLLVYVITAIFFGLCSPVIAYPTLTQTESSKSTSPDTYTVKDDSKNSDFFLLDWLYWLLDDVFGWDLNDHDSHYYSGDSGLGSNSGKDSGKGNLGNDSGGTGFSFDSGEGDLGFDPGDSGPDFDSGDGGLGFNPDDGGPDFDFDDSGWSIDSGDGDLDFDSGDGGWGINSGNGGWSYEDIKTDTGPVQSIPAPGALILGGIGSGIVGCLRRRRII